MNRQRFLILVMAALAGLILAALAAMMTRPAVKVADSTPNDGQLIAVTPDAFGGDFALTDHTGKDVTDKDFTGKYRLIYFGFTFCPAICPTELSKITAALNEMGPKGVEILPMFITIDPERDTADKMKSYVSLFHPRLVGLTGTPEQIKSVLKDYKIYANKVQDPQMSEYTMDHSSFIYLMAPDDRLLRIFKVDDTAQDIARLTAQWLDQEISASHPQ